MPKCLIRKLQRNGLPSAPQGIGAVAFDKAFNERHILAISQAICLYRNQQKIDGPLFLAWILMHSLFRPLPAQWKAGGQSGGSHDCG